MEGFDELYIVTPQGTFKPENEGELNEFMDALGEAIVSEETSIKNEFNVSDETASAICYLRGRSRWTQEKEQELIDRDHAGNPISINVVLRGDF